MNEGSRFTEDTFTDVERLHALTTRWVAQINYNEMIIKRQGVQ